MKRCPVVASLFSGLIVVLVPAIAQEKGCAGEVIPKWQGNSSAVKMVDGFALYAPMNINIDGYERAYHRNNYDTDAVIHLCNAGRVYLPDGSSYEGSASNAICTGKFMTDVAKIEAAGWQDASVGAVEWYGVLGTGSARIGNRTISGVKPVLQQDGSGYYVSPTSLYDSSVAEAAQQKRYIPPLKVPAAVVPKRLRDAGVKLGTFGVAISGKNIAVPFVVGDVGPKVGEGSPALARKLAGLPASDTITRPTRYTGQVDTPTVLWVFFGGEPQRFDHKAPEKTVAAAQQAFEHWGGTARLTQCMSSVPKP